MTARMPSILHIFFRCLIVIATSISLCELTRCLFVLFICLLLFLFFFKVLDGGRIKEFEHAHMLFQNPNSLFRKMVAQLGSSAASKLHNIAREDFSHRVISSVHMELPHCMIEITEENERDSSDQVSHNVLHWCAFKSLYIMSAFWWRYYYLFTIGRATRWMHICGDWGLVKYIHVDRISNSGVGFY